MGASLAQAVNALFPPKLWASNLNWGHTLWQVLALLAVAFVALWVVGALLDRLCHLLVRGRGEEGLQSPEQHRRLTTLLAILRSGLKAGIVVMAFLLLLSQLGVNVGPVLAGAGVLGVAAAFGAQSLVKDLFYGFFILAENQFGLGDVIQVGGDNGPTGLVERMTYRIVMLRDIDGRAHLIPNGEITRVTVYSKEWARANLDIVVDFDEDLARVFDVLNEVGEDLHREHPEGLLEPAAVMGVESLGTDGVKIKVLAKTAPLQQWDMLRLLRRRILETFQREGIALYPVRVPLSWGG